MSSPELSLPWFETFPHTTNIPRGMSERNLWATQRITLSTLAQEILGGEITQIGDPEEFVRGLAERVHSFLGQPDAGWAFNKPVAIHQVIQDNMESLIDAAERLLGADDYERERIIMELHTPTRIPSFAEEAHIQAGQRMLTIF